MLTHGAGNQSVGQRQRVALARTLMGKPRILLLDEADANLDPAAREALDKALRRFEGTIVMVTHDLERVRRADVVWHLEGGLLVETGPPQQVLGGLGPTARLFERVEAARKKRRRRSREARDAGRRREAAASDARSPGEAAAQSIGGAGGKGGGKHGNRTMH